REPFFLIGKLSRQLVRHALAVIIATSAVAVEAARAHVHATRDQQLGAVRQQHLIGRADEMLVRERTVVAIREPTSHVHAVAGEEHTESLHGSFFLSSGVAWSQSFEVRQAHQHTAEAGEKPAPREASTSHAGCLVSDFHCATSLGLRVKNPWVVISRATN